MNVKKNVLEISLHELSFIHIYVYISIAVCELAKSTREKRDHRVFLLVHRLMKREPFAAGADFSSHFDLDNLIWLASSLRNLKQQI